MKDLKLYIIEESIKDKIKGWISKFKKSKEPEKIFTEDDLNEFKDKSITEEDVDKIINIREKLDKSSFLFGNPSNNYNYNLRKLSYKQAILDYAYLNFKDQLNQDKFGERHADSAYYKACKDNGYNSSSISAGSIGLSVLGRYFYGWSCAQELNLKCETKIEVNFCMKLKNKVNKE